MDLNYDDADKPLLLVSESSGGDADEFFDADLTSSEHSPSQPPQWPSPAPEAEAEPALASSASYFGKASPLSTGLLFSATSGRGIVDALPHPNKPCLLFADHDPLAAVAHICLLEKEFHHWEGGATRREGDGDGPALFTVVHVCEPLAGRGDAGTRLLRKIDRDRGLLRPPALLHEGNIYQEAGEGGLGRSWAWAGGLLPEYIDAAIGEPDLLKPKDAVGRYNMNLFIQRHSQLPSLFHRLLTDPSPIRRHTLAADLLALLKVIDADLQSFDEGPYLCGVQLTLADVAIFPAMERVKTVLSIHRGFWIPSALTRLLRWYDAMAARPAVEAATADRSSASRSTYCYESSRRKEYLVEVSECQVREGGAARFRELTAQWGRAGENVYRQAVEEDVRDLKVCEKTNCRNWFQ